MTSAVDNRKIRCDLRHAPDCDLLAVTGIALSRSARTAHPFGLPFACSIAGTPDSPQRPFPAWLQPAIGLRQQLRQADCESNFSFALAHERAHSTCSADLFCLQIFPKTAVFRRFFLRGRHFLRSRFQPRRWPACACRFFYQHRPLGPIPILACRVFRAHSQLAPRNRSILIKPEGIVKYPRLASGSDRFDPLGTLHPTGNSRCLPFARPSASSISATGSCATFIVQQSALAR